MKNTGAILKAKRESSNLSLSEVALATKINPKILAAIENGDESHLPAKTILKGFIRSYALFLKMDVDQVLRSFLEETGGVPSVVPIVTAEAPRPAKSETSSRRRVNDESSSGMRTVAVVVIVLLIGLIIGIRELIEKYQRERIVEASRPELQKVTPVVNPITPPPQKTEEPKAEVAASSAADVAPETEDEVEIESTTVEVDKTAEVKPSENHAPVPTPAPAAETAAPRTLLLSRPMDLMRPPVSNLVEVRSMTETPVVKPAETTEPVAAAEQKPAAKEEAPTELPTPAPTEKPSNLVLKAAKNEIILEALDKVEVKFQVKGETKRISLGPTQVHTIHADQALTLDLSDGGAVNIILNGRERGVPGDLGKPKTIKIP